MQRWSAQLRNSSRTPRQLLEIGYLYRSVASLASGLSRPVAAGSGEQSLPSQVNALRSCANVIVTASDVTARNELASRSGLLPIPHRVDDLIERVRRALLEPC